MKQDEQTGLYIPKPSRMSAFDVLSQFSEATGGLWSTEKPSTRATKSEMRRWFDNKAIVINGETPGWSDTLDYWESVVMFPKGKRRTTLL